jgi:hypothetical protein
MPGERRIELEDRNTVHNVRQVLMNELGLTRESIREMVREIVSDTIGKYMASDQFRQYMVGQLAGSNVASLVRQHVDKEVGRQVRERLGINVTWKPDPKAPE